MKELPIEEKAKRYDEALALMQDCIPDENGLVHVVPEEIFPELADSEDEKIRKSLIDMLKNDEKCYLKEIAWLEKQGEHQNFRDKIQIGDQVTRNDYGVLVNLSQLKRVAKPADVAERQGEQKPADKVEPKFKHGDRVRNKKSGLEQTLGSCIEDVYEGAFPFRIKDQDDWELVEQKPTELPKGEDYGIDGLYAAVDILQKTLGSVEGYQTDDGILEHECAVSAVKKLYEQKPAWSEEDETVLNNLIYALANDRICNNRDEYVDWLKSLKERYTWKPSDEHY